MAAVGKSAGAAPIAELVRRARRNLLAVERFRVRKQSNRLTTNRIALGDKLAEWNSGHLGRKPTC